MLPPPFACINPLADDTSGSKCVLPNWQEAQKEILDISIFPQISRDDKTDTGGVGRNGPVNGNGSIVFPAWAGIQTRDFHFEDLVDYSIINKHISFHVCYVRRHVKHFQKRGPCDKKTFQDELHTFIDELPKETGWRIATNLALNHSYSSNPFNDRLFVSAIIWSLQFSINTMHRYLSLKIQKMGKWFAIWTT